MNRFLKFLVIASLAWAIPGNADFSVEKIKQTAFEWCKSYDIKSCPKDLLATYGVIAACALCHELGHALMVKILLNSNSTINLGGTSKPTKDPLLNLSGFTISSLNPCIGCCIYDRPVKTQPWKKIVISLAGPLLGSVGSYFMFRKLMKTDPEHLKYPMATSTTLINVPAQLLFNLVPVKSWNNDGWHILQALRGKR